MGDPLSDDRAIWLLKAQPAEVSSLAAQFHRVASQAERAATGLRGAEHDATWTGAAAEAFRHQLGKLPGDLDRVQRSYGGVASVLDAYEGELAPLRSQFKQLATQIGGVRGRLTSAQSALSSADQSWKAAAAAPHATPTSPAVVAAGNQYNAANGLVRNLNGELSGLETAAYRLLDEFAGARDRAHAGIRQAGGVAPQHHSSWFSGLWHAVGDFMSGTAHFVVSFAKRVVKSAESLPGDVWKVMSNPLSLKAWSKLGEDAGTVAAAVGLVAAVVLCPADALGLEGLAGVAEGAGGLAETAGGIAIGTKTAADVGLVAEGKGSAAEVGFDLLSAGAGKLDLPGVKGAEADVTHLSAKSSALESYGLSRAEGLTHSEALRSLGPEERAVITHSAQRLSSSARINYMRSTTATELGLAKTHAARLGLANEIVHSSVDQGLDEIKKKAIPEGAKG